MAILKTRLKKGFMTLIGFRQIMPSAHKNSWPLEWIWKWLPILSLAIWWIGHHLSLFHHPNCPPHYTEYTNRGVIPASERLVELHGTIDEVLGVTHTDETRASK